MIVFYTLVGIGNSLLSVQYIMITKDVVDIATGMKEGDLVYSIVVALAMLLLKIAVESFLSMFAINITSPFANHIRRTVMGQLLDSEWIELNRFNSGDVITRFNNDAGVATLLLSAWLPSAVVNISKLISVIVSMFVLDSFLSLIALCVLPISVGLTRIFAGKMRKYNRVFQQSNSDNAAFIQDALGNPFIIKSFGLKEEMLERMDDSQNRIQFLQIKQREISAAADIVSKLGYSIGYFLALIGGAIRLSKSLITFGTMTAFLQLVNQVESLITSILSSFTTMASAYVQVERLIEMVTLSKDVSDGQTKLSGPVGIQISNMSCQYQDGHVLLRNVNLTIHPGKSVAIVGPTGSGKTTLVRLLLNFMHPSNGEILLFNDTESVPVSTRTRVNFTYVPQGTSLFADTIENNLRWIAPDASLEEINEALHHACADFVFSLPDGLQTQLKGRLAIFSEGQLQRLSIARSLLSKAPVLLLDEATSALDVQTEAKILENIRCYYPEKTSILVTHSKNAAMQCDEVYVISADTILPVREFTEVC
ncbi:MAG: ABC transporter ATP-binding protein [Clostridiales bacterium]|nr:ABC transporter ATP-binding protein [Clostridiales bacterium]